MRKKLLDQQGNRAPQNEAMYSSGYKSLSGSIENSEHLIVATQFSKQAVGQAKELKHANKTRLELKKANRELMRKLKTEQRKRQQITKKTTRFT